MGIGAKRIIVKNMANIEDVEITYWVRRDEEEDGIGIEIDTMGDMTVDDAERVASAIKRMAAWSKGRIGRKKIAEVREKVIAEEAA